MQSYFDLTLIRLESDTIGLFRVENSTVIQMKIQTKFVFEFEHGLPWHSVGV